MERSEHLLWDTGVHEKATRREAGAQSLRASFTQEAAGLPKGDPHVYWMALVLAGGSLVFSAATLYVALDVRRSARRAERAGDERLEILREQQERLAFLREERRMLDEELEWRRSIMEGEERPLALDAPRDRTGERDPSGRARALLGGAGFAVAEVPPTEPIRGLWVADGRKVSVAGTVVARVCVTTRPHRPGGMAFRGATE